MLVKTKTKDLVRAFDNNTPININDNIYRHTSVKKVLKTIQNNKCAYCEVSLTQQYGDVEHFRPKARIKAKS